MQATVGIAMGSGTEVASGNDLLSLVDAMKISRRCAG